MRMHRIDRMWEAAAHQYNHAYNRISTYPDSTWDTGAKQMRRVRQLYDRQAVRLGLITPPAGMKHGQQGWETSIQLTAQEIDTRRRACRITASPRSTTRRGSRIRSAGYERPGGSPR